MIISDIPTLGNVILFFVAALPAAVIIIGLFAAAHKIKMRMISRLKYSREFSEHDVVEGDEIEIVETVYNPTLIPFFFLDIASYIDGNLYIEGHSRSEEMQLVISRFHLLPFMKLTRHYKVKCLRRGHYRMESAAVLQKKATLEYSKSFAVDSEVYVYPVTLPYEYSMNTLCYVHGGELSRNRFVTDPFSIVGIRDYAFGDPFNTINFKASAKCAYQGTGCIKINRFEHNSDRLFMIYLNFQHTGEYAKTDAYEKRMEKAISACAKFVAEATDNGHRVGFAANCHSDSGENKIVFPILGGHYHSKDIMRSLASLRIDHASSFISLVETSMKNGLSMAEVFVISPCTDDHLEEAVGMLRRRNAVEVVML